MAVASAGPYASLHLTPDRSPHQHLTTQFFYRPDALPATQPTALKPGYIQIFSVSENRMVGSVTLVMINVFELWFKPGKNVCMFRIFVLDAHNEIPESWKPRSTFSGQQRFPLRCSPADSVATTLC